MKLSNRLQMNVSLVPKGAVVADIGCDHGYASIWLVKNDIAKKVIASDVNQGPIERAREHVERYGVQAQVDCRLGSGTEKIQPGEVNTLMIAGMGGPLMVDILRKGKAVVDRVDTLVLQPQSEIEDVRRFIWENGFTISCEKICIDENKFYFALLCERADNEKSSTKKSRTECRYGTYLIEHKHPDMIKYLEKTRNTYQNILTKTIWSDKNQMRKKELEQLLAEVNDCLERMGFN